MSSACRTCLQNAGIFDVFSANNAILNKLAVCSPIQIRKDDPHSKRICKSCFDKLESAYSFWKMCEESADKLEDYSVPIKVEFPTATPPATTIKNPVKIKFDNGINLTSLIKKVKTETTTSKSKKEEVSVKQPKEIKEEQCEFCTLKFNSTPSLYRHYQLGHAELVHECLVCNEKMKGVFIFKTHMKTHERFVCEFCGLQMKSKHGMRKHVENVHTKGSVKVCEVCSKLLPSESAYKTHMQQLHGELAHTCEFCGKVLASQRSLTMHIKRHKDVNVKKVPCRFCTQIFNDEESKTKHEEMHKLGYTEGEQNNFNYEVPLKKEEPPSNLFSVANLS